MMRTVCLATPAENPAGFEAAQKHFEERGLAVDFLYGLHHSTAGLIPTHHYDADRPDRQASTRIGGIPTHNWIGQYMMWNALCLSGDPRWFVLECDAEFPENWQERFDQALTDAPEDTDVLFMGSCCTGGIPRTHIQGNIWRLRSGPCCTHAYVITREAAEIARRTIRKVWGPMDIQWASELWADDPLPNRADFPPSRKLNTYVVLPRIVEQRGTSLWI
jgi:hypothetical protein